MQIDFDSNYYTSWNENTCNSWAKGNSIAFEIQYSSQAIYSREKWEQTKQMFAIFLSPWAEWSKSMGNAHKAGLNSIIDEKWLNLANVSGMTLNDCQEYGSEIGVAYFTRRKWNIKADYKRTTRNHWNETEHFEINCEGICFFIV